MPNPLDNAATSDLYTDACTIDNVFGSNGGWFNVQNNDVFVQLQYGGLGQTYWTSDQHLNAGAQGIIPENATGIRFRSYTSGQSATVSGALSTRVEPALVISAFGTASVALTGITGQLNADGSVARGTGFTCVNNSTGKYTVTFNTAFSVVPTVLVSLDQGGSGSWIQAASITTTSFVCFVGTISPFVGSNIPWQFVALKTI